MSEHPASGAHAAASAHTDPPSPRAQIAALSVFGAPGSKEHYGWVAISRRQSGSWVAHFNGYAISETSLPPPGTILSAKIMLPIRSEPQAGTNDQSKLQSRLPSGACVRVLSTQRRQRSIVGRGRAGLMLVSERTLPVVSLQMA